jgi:hypothetical protein
VVIPHLFLPALVLIFSVDKAENNSLPSALGLSINADEFAVIICSIDLGSLGNIIGMALADPIQ